MRSVWPFENVFPGLAGRLSWLEHRPIHHKIMGLTLVRAHSEAAGSIPDWDSFRRQPMDVSLSHCCFSLCLSLPL